MVKERQPKYCYLNLSDDDDEETLTLDLLDKINFKIMCGMSLTMAARLTRIHSAYSDTCSDDYLDDNDVNSE